jgi:DNA-binding transcriptional MerR regulator
VKQKTPGRESFNFFPDQHKGFFCVNCELCIEVIAMSDTSNINTASDVELIHDTSSVSKMLGVQESTLRKYCALMQKKGYQFQKNTVGHRVFYEADIDVFKEIIELKNSSSMTLDESVEKILNPDIVGTSDITPIEAVSDIDYKNLLGEFSSFKQEQQRFNAELLKQLQSQQDYIKNSIEERDRKLMLALKESQEARREIASANQKKWWHFWK